MKKLWLLAITLLMMFSLVACKSSEVKDVEKLIADIGVVSLDSADRIMAAETAYNQLSAEDQEQVANHDVLIEALETVQIVDINIDNLTDYFTIEKTIEDFEYEAHPTYGFVDYASATLNVRIYPKTALKAENITFNLGLDAWNLSPYAKNLWKDYDNLDYVTLSEDGHYERSFTVEFNEGESTSIYLDFEEPRYSVLFGELNGKVITMTK